MFPVSVGPKISGNRSKFSLGGNRGLAVLAAGYPKAEGVVCPLDATPDPIELTASAGNSGLTYDAATGVYTCVWKTTRAGRSPAAA